MVTPIEWLHDFIILIGWNRPPWASFFLVLVIVLITILSNWLTKLLVNQRDLNRYTTVTNQFKGMQSALSKTKDPKLWVEIKNRSKSIDELNQRFMFKRLIPQVVISGMYIFVFSFFRGVMGDPTLNLTPARGGVVAILPFQIPSWIPFIGGWFSQYALDPRLSVAGFGSWYLIAAMFTSSVLLPRIFGYQAQRMM